MPLQVILSFFLLLHLRKALRSLAPDPQWERRLTYGIYAVVALFVLEILFPVEEVIKWVSYLLLAAIIVFTFRTKALYSSRLVLYAVLPLVAVHLISDLAEIIDTRLNETIEGYATFAYPVAITWMIALLIRSKKQQKALQEERRLRQEEEEQHRLLALRKAELEGMVQERTAELRKQKEELQEALEHLKTTQAQLVQKEKMASLGELTAGIAHEIQNPLNFINNFSEVNRELIAELKHEVERGNMEQAKVIAKDIEENEEKIGNHGRRADAIVKSMLEHSRSSKGEKQLTDVNALVDEYLRLAYHGMRAKDKSFNAVLETHYDPAIGKISMVPQDIGRVLLNLFNNAFYAVSKKKQSAAGYEPVVSVSTKKAGDKIEIAIRDNGTGVPQNIADKIFQPFFTTKPTGEGTGLGLSLSYDIITKGHGGELKFESKEGAGAAFRIQFPAT